MIPHTPRPKIFHANHADNEGGHGKDMVFHQVFSNDQGAMVTTYGTHHHDGKKEHVHVELSFNPPDASGKVSLHVAGKNDADMPLHDVKRLSKFILEGLKQAKDNQPPEVAKDIDFMREAIKKVADGEGHHKRHATKPPAPAAP